MKISRIILEGFRAFDEPFPIDLGKGKNLLLHGDNGSGKSSIYLALRRFLEAQGSDIALYRNQFSKVGRQSHVRIQFRWVDATGDHEEEVDWNAADGHPVAVPPSPATAPVGANMRARLVDGVHRAGFIDYRMVLRTHLISAPSSRSKSGSRTYDPVTGASAPGLLEGQFFDVAARSMLAGVRVTIPGGREITIGELIQQAWNTVPASRREAHLTRANAAAQRFNDAFNAKLPELQAKLSEFLAYFDDHELDISFRPVALRWDKWSLSIMGAELIPDVIFRGQPILDYYHFLNEARLSALGICLFLAGVAISDTDPANPDHPRFLLLDDALIGLDYQHRQPLLRLLKSDAFKWFQVFVLTHDRVWFDLARAHLPEKDGWSHQELRTCEDAGIFVPKLKDSKDDLTRSRQHLHNGDLKAAAVYARSAFEWKLQSVAEKHGLGVPFKSNTRHVSAEMLWSAVTAEQSRRQAAGEPDFIPPSLIGDVNVVRSNVLNRLSHTGVSTLVPTEVQDALDAVRRVLAHDFPDRGR